MARQALRDFNRSQTRGGGDTTENTINKLVNPESGYSMHTALQNRKYHLD